MPSKLGLVPTKKSSVPLRIWKLAASAPSSERVLVPRASSVMLRLPILTPALVSTFSAMVLAERLMFVGASLTLETLRATIRSLKLP